MNPLSSTSCVLVLLLVTAVTGCTRDEGARASGRPVLLIGVDGLEPTLVEEMIAAGRLPNLSAIVERGTYTRLRVSKPTLSPIIWTSIATGVTVEQHGIAGFVHQSKTPGDAPLYTSADRRVKAFWNITSEGELPAYVVGWWNTFPIEPIDGIMVAQVNTITPAMRRAGKGIWKGRLIPGLEGQVHPSTLQAELLAMLPEVEASVDATMRRVFDVDPRNVGRVARRLLEQSRWAFRADALYHRIGVHLLETRPAPAVFAIYFGGGDVVGHRFWRYLRPDRYDHPPSAREVLLLGDVVPAYYRYLDSLIGDIVDRAPRHSTVIVISDHGMQAANRHNRFRGPALSGGHLGAPPAFLAVAGTPFKRAIGPAEPSRPGRKPVGSILDLMPTLLALLDLPVGRDMPGRVLSDLFEPGWLDAHPVAFVDTHTDAAWRSEASAASLPRAAMVERLEQLRSLGYVD